MRRIACAFLLLCLLGSMALGVRAATGVSSLSGFATVASDGGCQISMTMTLHLEEALTKLYFPIPAAASGVALNGSRVSAPKSGQVRNINLSRLVRNVLGDVTVSVQYSLYDVISVTEADSLQLQLPLLSGFNYPIEKMECSVTLPAPVETLPGFISGYHQARIEEDLSYTVSGPVISISTIRALKDQETLTLTLPVSRDVFPRTLTHNNDYSWTQTAMLLCTAAALLFWTVGMWNRPGLARTQPEPPQGYSAGSLGCLLAGTGLDLTMAVLSWAQLGYVLIHLKGHKVILYRAMEMGNERSETEVRWFRKLFGKKDRVDTSELRYALLCRLAAKRAPDADFLLRRFNGDPRIFRGIAGLIGLFGGLGIAVAMADGAALQGFLMVIFGICGAFSGWYIQLFGRAFFLRDRRLLTISLSLSALWLALSLLCGAPALGLTMTLLLLLCGILLAWGGRRTPLGRLNQMQTRGFARYLQKVSPAQLQHICKTDPDYFFRLAPYALALGREKLFAAKFGAARLDRCPYLTTGMDGHMTALQWASLMRRTADAMNARANRLPLEKTLRVIRNLTRG